MAIYDRAVERLQAGVGQGAVRGDFYQQMGAYRSRRETDRILGDSVRVSSAAATTAWPCLVGPYREIRKICPGEAHHIVPEMALRYGKDTNAEHLQARPDLVPDTPGLAVSGNIRTSDQSSTSSPIAACASSERALMSRRAASMTFSSWRFRSGSVARTSRTAVIHSCAGFLPADCVRVRRRPESACLPSRSGPEGFRLPTGRVQCAKVR